MYKKFILCLGMLYCLLYIPLSFADITVAIYQIDDTKTPGDYLGEVVFTDTDDGLLVTPDLKNLPPGPHGFHIHTNPDCKNLGMAAGGHFDPHETGKHSGPDDVQGHIGDLPELEVSAGGTAQKAVIAPRLTEANIGDHALMIHAGGDNYSDEPEPLGGGGSRIACGIIKVAD